jgi:ADP-ribose pyrophosphatase
MQKRPLPQGVHRHSEKAKKVFSGIRFDVYQWPQKLFDGTYATFEVVKRNDTVVVIPIVDEKVILVKELQPHWTTPGLALIAGMVEDGEDLQKAAKRELEEETGMIFHNFDLVHVTQAVPAVEWNMYTFIATGYKSEQAKKLDSGEQNEVVNVTFDELIQLTRERGLLYPPSFIEDFIIRDAIDDLKNVFQNPSEHAIKI